MGWVIEVTIPLLFPFATYHDSLLLVAIDDFVGNFMADIAAALSAKEAALTSGVNVRRAREWLRRQLEFPRRLRPRSLARGTDAISVDR